MSKRLPAAAGMAAAAAAETPVGMRVVTTRLRSTNLERDVRAETLGRVHVSVRAQDVLHRIVAAVRDHGRTRAWSITGPYGSGKSTCVLLLEALLGAHPGRMTQAQQLLSATNPELTARFATSRTNTAPSGFIGALATARREPLATTLARALRTGVTRRWPAAGEVPERIVAAMQPLTGGGVGSKEILEAVEALCGSAPVLLVVDEFGKNLEHLAGQGEAADAADDLFLLQELSEAGAGINGLPLFLLTLQHQAFLDYASRSTLLQRREWAKIQGRFESITFRPEVGDAVALISGCLDQTEVSEDARKLIGQHAHAAQRAWARRGLDGILQGSQELFARLYPLHPLTAVVSPLLAAQVGQHDRTLTGFLGGDEPHTVVRYLTAHARHDATWASTVRLPQLYDYFFASGYTTMLTSAQASRWIEIDGIISQTHALPAEDQEILKTVGLLNLVDAAGALRASLDMVLFALSDPLACTDTPERERLRDRLKELETRGFLVYRNFSDEYRVWRGSDVDLRSRIDELRERCSIAEVVGLLRQHLPGAVVAGRHSQRTGMLRHFVTAVTGPDSPLPTPPGPDDPADGLLVFHLGTTDDLPTLAGAWPTVAGVADRAGQVLEVGRELFALEELLLDHTLDAVARREVAERAGQARAEFTATLTAAFIPSCLGTRWYLLPMEAAESGGQEPGQVLEGRSFAAIVSAACDIAYPHTPAIRNEMLGRHQLTSQGAKARRELMVAMLEHPDKDALGIQGYGPERAMYDGVLAYLGLHQTVGEGSPDDQSLVRYGYTEPDADQSLAPAWAALRELLTTPSGATTVQDVFRRLQAPPIGVKAGATPIIVLIALVVTADEVAVFEDGTYRPRLTPDLAERLVKAPDRFMVKAMPTRGGQRRRVLDQLAATLGVPAPPRRSKVRNPALLAVTRVLIEVVRGLTPYALKTRRLSPAAAAVRTALVTSQDPDALIFTVLPEAVGVAPVPPGGPADEHTAKEYASRLADALRELQAAPEALRQEALGTIARAFSLPSGLHELRQEFAARAHGFVDAPLEPSLKGLIDFVVNDRLPDEDWLGPVIMRIAGDGLEHWTDEHARRFGDQVQRFARALDRVSHLFRSDRLDPSQRTFDSRLLTLTDPAGREQQTLIHVPHTLKDTAADYASQVAKEAERQFGAGGGRILLAALAQALTTSPPPPDHSRDPGQDTFAERAS